MHLPPEIQDEILRHLGRHDVASYRLICRQCASTGAPHLFDRLHFHTSLQSLQRLAHISKCDCGRHVKHLLWNTTGSEYEARAFLEGLRMRDLKFVLGGATPNAPAYTVEKSEEELAGDIEQSNNLGVFLLRAILSGFPNLKSLYIVTSGTQPNAFADDNWAKRTSQHSTSDAWPKLWKAKNGCSACFGLCQAIQSRGRYEMQAALLAAHTVGQPLTHLRVENLDFWAVRTEPVLQNYEKAFAHLSSLELVLTAPNRAVEEVKALFQSLPALQCLKLWLHSSSWWEGVDHCNSGLRLQDIFPSPGSFPRLQELEVHQLDVSQDFLTSFLLAHSRTLKVLKIHRMRLVPVGSWSELVADVRGKMNVLEVVWLHDNSEIGIEESREDMDALYEQNLETSLIRREGLSLTDEQSRFQHE